MVFSVAHVYHQTLKTLTVKGNRLVSPLPDLSELSTIERIDLSHNRVEQTISIARAFAIPSFPPSEVILLSGERALTLNNLTLLQITEMPPLPTAKGSRLTELSFGYNQVRISLSIALRTHLLFIPLMVAFCVCSDLPVSNPLSLPTYAQLDSCEEAVGVLTLSVLDIRDNRLLELPRTIGQMRGLKILDVSNNDLSDLPPELGVLACPVSVYSSGHLLGSKVPADRN